jgi:hypothetical protein
VCQSANHVNLFAKALELLTHSVQLVICGMALLECILQEAGKVAGGVSRTVWGKRA